MSKKNHEPKNENPASPPSSATLPAAIPDAPVTSAAATVPAISATSILPATVGASPELLERINEVKENLESVENFRLPRIRMTSDGAEILEGEEPVEAIEGVILHTKKTNTYYDKPFSPANPEPPTCFSLDGVKPDKSVKAPVNPTCKGCKMAEFGTNAMKSGKACRNLKPIYLLLSDEAIMPRQLTITPSALKAANQYLLDLTERGLNYRKVRTRIEFYKETPKDTYMKARFRMVGKLDENRARDVEYLRNTWLPVMNNQSIDQNEFESGNATNQERKPVETGGEY
jgi:hypothetical protein